jgi:hypothetical protein
MWCIAIYYQVLSAFCALDIRYVLVISVTVI